MKKLLTILVLIMLIISFFQITSMYALYKEQINGDYSSLLGAWEIRVNGTDITTSGQTETFTITDSQLGYVTSDYIQAGKIAPDGQAYFDIVIDPSNVYTDEDTQTDTTVYNDVSIVYTIEVLSDTTENAIANIELISAEDYFKKDGETDQVANDETYQFQEGNFYTSVIPVSKILEGYKNYVRLYFEWTNVEANNETDTVMGETEGYAISVPLEIKLKQYTGEVIGNGS